MANPILCMFAKPFKARLNAKKLNNNNYELNEKYFVPLNGIEQYITIRGQKKDNPIILIIHGGPGSSYTPFNVYLLDWEKHFTIVQWDQIGSGHTFRKNGKVAELSFDRLANDGVSLAKHLCKKLGHKRLIVMGSSAGSLVALKMLRKAPECFCAYIGTNQNSPYGSFFPALKEWAKKYGKKHLAYLKEVGDDASKWSKEDTLKIAQLAINSDRKGPNMVYDLMLPAIMYDKEYSMKNIKLMSKGMDFTLEKLYKEMTNFDFETIGFNFNLPFFIFQGENDPITIVDGAKEFFKKISAPHKELVIIKNAGHLCEFANPEQVLRELLNRVLPAIL